MGSKQGLLGTVSVIGGAFLILALLVGGSFYVLTLDSSSQASDFTVTDTDGVEFNLVDHRGSIVLIDFFGVACADCGAMAEELVQVRADNPDIVMISIDIYKSESNSDIEDFKVDHGATWPHALDTDDLSGKYQVTELAKIVIVDEDGIVRYDETSSLGVGGLSPTAEDITSALTDIRAGEAEAVGITSAGLIGLALIAGVTTFFSPCSFPLLPGFVAVYLGRKRTEGESLMARAGIPLVGVLSGFLLIFGIITAAVIALGSLMIPIIGILQPIVGALFLILGIVIFLPLSYGNLFSGFLNFTGKADRGVFLPMFGYGAGYAAASAGCTLPVFAALFIGAISTGSILSGLVVMMVWSGSATVLMGTTVILVASGETVLVRYLNRFTPWLKYIMAGALILVGVYLLGFFLLTL